MPEIKILAPTSDFIGIVVTQDDKPIDIREYSGRRIKRATRLGCRVVIHLVDAAPGELLVFQTPDDYERAIRREVS